MAKFGKRSLSNLETCHPSIQKVLSEAIKYFDFSVLCGYRNQEDQDKAYSDGFSKVKFPNGKHNTNPSLAVDIAPYPINWDDISRFHFMAGVILTVANQLNIELEWGGNWKSFKDYPHFQLKNKKESINV